VNEVLWAAQVGYPPLATLQWLPLAGALLLLIMREQDLALILGRVFAVGELVVAIDLYARIDVSTSVLQFAERVDQLAYHAAADGVSVLFILLTALLGALLSFYGMARQQIPPVRLLSVLLLTEASLMTMLTTMNLLWFAAASAVQLALVGYLLWRWASSPEESLALSRFLQYQLFGWCLFVAGAVVLAWSHVDVVGGHWSFDLFELLQTPQIGKYQSAAFYLLFYGLAVRTPLFPLHGWLPNSAGYGLIAVGPVLLLGVKVGIYGMARFLLPLTADAVMLWQPYVVAFAMVGVFFAAAMAFRQANLRRLMAFAVVSHTSLIVIGLFTLHPAGLAGRLAAGRQLRPGDHRDAADGRLCVPPHRHDQPRPAGRPVRSRPLHRRRLPDRRPGHPRHARDAGLRRRASRPRGVDRNLRRACRRLPPPWVTSPPPVSCSGLSSAPSWHRGRATCRRRGSRVPGRWSTSSAVRRWSFCSPPASGPSRG
jgi:hypothetical protein